MSTDTFVVEATLVLVKELPGFWYRVRPYKFLGHDLVRISIAVHDHDINGVEDQKPQYVGLTYDVAEQELDAHYSCIYRKPNMDDPKEKYLAMKGIKVPSRKNKPGHQIEALRKFCRRYKALLKEHRDVLMYQDIVDYKTLSL